MLPCWYAAIAAMATDVRCVGVIKGFSYRYSYRGVIWGTRYGIGDAIPDWKQPIRLYIMSGWIFVNNRITGFKMSGYRLRKPDCG